MNHFDGIPRPGFSPGWAWHMQRISRRGRGLTRRLLFNATPLLVLTATVGRGWRSVVICTALAALASWGIFHAGLRIRNAAALRHVFDRASFDLDLRLHTVDDYIPDDQLPAAVYTEGKRPRVLIVYSPEYQNYDSIQIGRSHQIIILPFSAATGKALQFFYLLHELGHTGPRNIRAAAGVLTAFLAGSAGVAAMLFLFEWPAGIFPQIAFVFTLTLALGAPVMNSGYDPLAAELEADHFAFVGLVQICDITRDGRGRAWLLEEDDDGTSRFHRLMRKEANPIWDDELPVPVDTKLDPTANALRRASYGSLRTTLRTSLTPGGRAAIEAGEAPGFPPPSVMLNAAERLYFARWMWAIEIVVLITMCVSAFVTGWFAPPRAEGLSIGLALIAVNSIVTSWIMSSCYFYITLVRILTHANEASFLHVYKRAAACAPLFSLTRLCLTMVSGFRALRSMRRSRGAC
jgi:uncharacterized membrane protein (DUF485 family)